MENEMKEEKEEEEKRLQQVRVICNLCNNCNNCNIDITDITNVTYYSMFSKRLDKMGYGAVQKILSLLSLSNCALCHKAISKITELTMNNVIVTMHRYSDYFQEAPKSLVKRFKLSPKGEELVKRTLKDYDKRMKDLQDSLIQTESQLKDKEKLLEMVEDLLSNFRLTESNKSIILDFTEVVKYNPHFADVLLDNPDSFIEALKLTKIGELGINNIRIKNLPRCSNYAIEELRTEQINNLISLHIRVVSVSSVRSRIKTSKWECSSCGSILKIEQDKIINQLKKPKRCPCGNRSHFIVLSKEMVDFANLMLEDLQENTDNPNVQRIKARIEEDLTWDNNMDIFTPGNEIKVTGILREEPVYFRGIETSEVGYVFEIMHAELHEAEIKIGDFKEDEINEIKKLSERIDKGGLDILCRSFAPDIFGNDEIKQAIILQLCNKKNSPGQSMIVRSKPNILLIGDPGIAKSVLGKFAVDVTIGARKAVGGGSSAVGVTASLIREEDSLGGYRVEPGALVLAKELLFLDELNNLSDDDKPKLQEGMSEGSVSINKANLHVNLKVTAGMLAVANPKEGVFKENENIISQFNIPIPIINRFDEIFVMRDNIDECRDSNIASKMIERDRKLIKLEYDLKFLRKFFVYIRAQPEPEITTDIALELQKVYTNVRKFKAGNLIINPRFMESLLRLIKASAKIRLSKKIEEKDIERAMEILSKSHYNIRTYSMLKSIYPSQQEEKEKFVLNKIIVLEEKFGKIIPLLELRKEVDNILNAYQLEEIIQKLLSSGNVFFPKDEHLQRI